MNSYIIVNGRSRLSDKINAVNKISSPRAREHWKTVLKENRNLISGSNRAVILNNRRASITFKFKTPVGNYDIYLRCIAPSSNTDTGVIRLDAKNPKILNLKRRPQKYISKEVTVKLFSNILLSNGLHKLTVGYREPIGLIRLIVRKRRSNLQIVIPAVNMLYKPRELPTIRSVVATYESTTQPPIIEAEYEPMETTSEAPYEIPTTTSEAPYEVITIATSEPPYEITTTTSESPYEIPTTTSEAPYEIPTTPSEAPYEIITTTSSSASPQIIPPSEMATSSTSQPFVIKPLEKKISKKKTKGLPWWAILLIIVVVCVLLFLVYRMWKGKTGKDDPKTRIRQLIQKLSPKDPEKVAVYMTALQKSPELLSRMLNCPHPNEKILLQWLQKRATDQSISPSLREEARAFVEKFKKSPKFRSSQQKADINWLLNCKGLNRQQQQLLQTARKFATDQNLQQLTRKRFSALVEALEKKPQQRNQQQTDLILFALNCKKEKQLLSKIQQKGSMTTSSNLPLIDYSFRKERSDQPQQTPAQKAPAVKTQIMDTTMISALADKLIQEEKKRKLNILKDTYDQMELDAQVFALNRDKDVFQYLQKFDPSSKSSQQQFPKIKTRLNQLLPNKKDNSFIERILQQSLKKAKQEEQRQTSALQSAAALFGKAQQAAKKKQQEQRETRALQGASTLFRKAQQDLKPKLDFKKFLEVGQKQGIIKKDGGQNVSRISQILKKAKASSPQPTKPKVRLTPDTPSSQQADAYQRQFGQNIRTAPPAF